MGISENQLPPGWALPEIKYQAGAIAGLVRAIVYARKGISRAFVEEWVMPFFGNSGISDLPEHTRVIIDLLCELHDVGCGTVRSEPVLFSLPEQRVELPDEIVVALGDHGLTPGDSKCRLFPVVDGGATTTLIEYLKTFDAPEDGVSIPRIASEGKWSGPDPMPAALRAALALSGEFNPRTEEWTMSQANTTFLNGWFGSESETVSSEAARAEDNSQLDVIKAPVGAKIVVEAGPGSGKTHTATERVIRLMEEEEVIPSRILLLSFTRMAVAEIRARVLSRVDDIPQARTVQIRTFDSFAARVLSIAGTEAGRSFDDSIRRAIRALKSDNPLVDNGIELFEHVIIDEAQDLVGLRKEFCTALLERLDPACSITVFGDFAQSIYGYQASGPGETSLLTEIASTSGFEGKTLTEDHRTKTPELKVMFAEAREMLRDDKNGSKDSYFALRDRIRNAAKENGITDFEKHPSTSSGMILTRSRNSLFKAVEDLRKAGRQFRIRLPDRPEQIEAWIGAALGGIPGTERATRDEFLRRLEMLEPAADIDVDTAWETLLNLDGSGKKTVRINHVAEALLDPPRELVRDHQGNSGPLLSTIHAIKGREADRVMLLLTAAPNRQNVDWGEETRILYVGASRASRELRTGWINSNKKYYTIIKSERHWSPHRDHRRIEIGLIDDVVVWEDFVRGKSERDVALTLADIWKAGAEEIPAEVISDDRGGMQVQCVAGPDRPLGRLSDDFMNAVESLYMEDEDTSRPELITGFNITGATTVVTAESRNAGRSLGLMPLLGGFAMVPRNKTKKP